MPETITKDEVVSERAPAQRGAAARPTVTETVEASTGTAKTVRGNGVEDDTMSEGARKGRVLKESTEKLLAEMDKQPTKPSRTTPAPHEVGDADEDEPEAEADDTDDGADTADGGDAVEGEPAGEGEEPEDKAAEVDPIREAHARLEARNRELIGELEAARKTPKTQRTDRETALLAAEQSYIEEGSVPALRKFLSIIVGAAPDSKEVDAELTGMYLDLTSREVGVPLDQNQQALRDNARTRLLLARDKREKADAGKKAEPGNGADEAVQYENAAKYVDNLLTTKGESGKSIADEFPMLMTLAEDFDGFRPSEVLARAVRQEYMTGTLDPKGNEVDAIRVVAQKIEKHYDAVAEKIEAARAKKTKPGTTTPSGKSPKVASAPSQEPRKSEGARTITNATASRAPAKPPKTTKQKAETTEKARKDFPSDAAWREHLLSKHFES